MLVLRCMRQRTALCCLLETTRENKIIMTLPSRLQQFVTQFERLIDSAGGDEETILAQGRPLLGDLIGTDD